MNFLSLADHLTAYSWWWPSLAAFYQEVRKGPHCALEEPLFLTFHCSLGWCFKEFQFPTNAFAYDQDSYEVSESHSKFTVHSFVVNLLFSFVPLLSPSHFFISIFFHVIRNCMYVKFRFVHVLQAWSLHLYGKIVAHKMEVLFLVSKSRKVRGIEIVELD